MRYIIAGTATFSSQANRDAAKARLDTAMAGYTYTAVATTFTPGISLPNTTSLTISIDADGNEAVARGIYNDAMTALTSTNRFTAGYLSMSWVP